MIEKTLLKISEQQNPYSENNKIYWIGEQLKEIAEESKDIAELILNDLTNPDMSIDNAEKTIAQYARKHGGCCPYKVADKLLRKFYGLPEKNDDIQKQVSIINLTDFI